MKFKPEYETLLDILCNVWHQIREKREEYLIQITRLNPNEDQIKRARLKITRKFTFVPSVAEVCDIIEAEIKKDYVPGSGGLSDEELIRKQIAFYKDHIDKHCRYDPAGKKMCSEYVEIYEKELRELKGE